MALCSVGAGGSIILAPLNHYSSQCSSLPTSCSVSSLNPQGLVVLCAGSPEARVAATAQIVAVDPPSEGVPMSKVRPGTLLPALVRRRYFNMPWFTACLPRVRCEVSQPPASSWHFPSASKLNSIPHAAPQAAP